jgi:hypothetical protein
MMIIRKTYLHCLIYIDYKFSNIPDSISTHATCQIDLLYWTKTNLATGVLYASVALPADEGKPLLSAAVKTLLQGLQDASARVLWSLQYHQNCVIAPGSSGASTIILPNVPADLGLSDSVLHSVKSAWQQLTGEADGFMMFEAREGEDED